jgi:hypothetical protein
MNALLGLAELLDPTAPPSPSSLMMAAGLEPDPWQSDVLASTASRILLLCCRQAGKSTVTAALALSTVMTLPGALVLLISPSQRQSGELFRKVTGLLHAQAKPPAIIGETVLTLVLANGARIVALPGAEGTVRGFSGVDLLVVDEAAWVDDNLYRALRPMLAVSGGRLVALSTPFGKRGWFHAAWHSAEEWNRVIVTAKECPRISPKFLAEERASLGDWAFAQEYDCDFVDTASSMFTYDEVRAALSSDVTPLFPISRA